ncbi:poly(3-hydroxyalkanoic acid) depolymerase [Amylibacter ulvae]|uniref:Poly(3-hydroxyalkanoic acid) depolymerase n=1 Tax=Paramylibacter ulvae TaxID=1651968 RepID=A0ABQ3CZ04_9RHOB|nr:alpha/beta fold hydrolase [Amylibacter ulvae]GHA43019.1 poly(3-hydroxyalkanoic acid) depolymerase [Amylibacter ulvae]
METLTKTICGLEIRVGIFGKKDAKRTILFFNGIGARLEAAEKFAELLSDYRIVTFDVPGVGKSPAPKAPYRPALLSKMAGILLDELEIDKVDVFGISWGGAMAQQFVKDHQDRCHTMTLAATSAGMVMVPGKLSAMLKMVTPKRYFNPNYMLEVAPTIYGGTIGENIEQLEEFAKMVMGGSTRGYLYQLLAGYGWTSWLWLPQIKVPTLILMGNADRIVPPSNGRILNSRLPNSRLEYLDCGHLFMMTKPQETTQLMRDFYAEH